MVDSPGVSDEGVGSVGVDSEAVDPELEVKTVEVLPVELKSGVELEAVEPKLTDAVRSEVLSGVENSVVDVEVELVATFPSVKKSRARAKVFRPNSMSGLCRSEDSHQGKE